MIAGIRWSRLPPLRRGRFTAASDTDTGVSSVELGGNRWADEAEAESFMGRDWQLGVMKARAQRWMDGLRRHSCPVFEFRRGA